MKNKIKNFTENLAKGMKQEYHETKQIPKQIKAKEYKEAAEQIGDIGKMIFLSLLWVLPAGGVASAFLLKISHRFRPSAFKETHQKSRVLKYFVKFRDISVVLSW